jgi:hypothetical protein
MLSVLLYFTHVGYIFDSVSAFLYTMFLCPGRVAPNRILYRKNNNLLDLCSFGLVID